MSYSDHDFINFGEDHELNYILKQFDKRQTESNRNTLIDIGKDCKKDLNKTRVGHGEFYPYVRKNLSKLE